MKNRIEIELRLPLEDNIARALALPASPDLHGDKEIAGALRQLHELAHGRSVRTTVGLIPVAPPVAPFLSRTTFSVGSRSELLATVTDRIASTVETASSTRASQSN